MHNKDLLAATNLSEDEIKALYALPPNFTGVLITLFIQLVMMNTLSIIETLATPLVTDSSMMFTDNLNFTTNFAVSLFVTMGLCGLFGFMMFKRIYEQQRINKFSDRAFVFTTLVFGLVGSLVLIDYKQL